MPFNGSGGFVPVAAPDYPPVGGQPIYASHFITNMQDLFAGFANCVTRDGQSPATGNWPMGGFRLTGTGNGTAAGQALVYGQPAATAESWIPTSDTIPVRGLYGATEVRLATNTLERARVLSTGEWGFNCVTAAGISFRTQAPSFNDVGLEWQRTSATLGILRTYNRSAGLHRSFQYSASQHIWDISGSVKLELDAAGRLSGTALHNNATVPSGTAQQFVASGSYTPTATVIANCSGLAGVEAIWIRLGNVVVVAWRLVATVTTANTTTSFTLSLPLPTFTSSGGVIAGSGAGYQSPGTNYTSVSCDNAVANDAVFVGSQPSTTGAYNFRGVFVYMLTA